ncbi:hypothetical protein [Mesorhizobium sp.]|uniref:hypothetical protein n=1 Tax=Mesorhizobium sp. TaxID=1871066 RepID=UPI000FE7DEA1|nr:hypothetical protein [Mesorhizobium sp.]RWE85812.1 MAG: hypothetical protein EOS49_16650 [Mesorhizobium sp.]
MTSTTLPSSRSSTPPPKVFHFFQNRERQFPIVNLQEGVFKSWSYAIADGSMRECLRVDMANGSRNAFVGAVQRLRLDDQIALVAGALSSDPEKCRQAWCYITAVTLPAASRRQPTRACRTSMPPCLA